MKKIVAEVLLSVAAVAVPTFIIYGRLQGVEAFWSAQFLWSAALFLCWIVVALGYFHQGWLVREARSDRNVSAFLPTVVFFLQCILFVKGVYYRDWSLIGGAVLVNTGAVFNLVQIVKARKQRKHS